MFPAVGQNFPDVGGYELTGARFRFCGSSHDEVHAAVLRTEARAEVAFARLPPRGVVPRLAAVIAEAPTADQASTVLAEAMNLLDARYEPSPDVADPLITATARL